MATIRIPIISDFDSKGVEKATKQFEQLQTTGERAQFGLQKAAIPAGIALVALGAAAMSATSAAIQDAAAQDHLAGVLQRQTGATTAQIAETEAFVSSLSLATATADDELRPALASLVTATGDLGRSQALLRTAQDLAASSGSDLATAVDAVSKAVNGQMKGLAILDPSLKGVIASGASFDKIMRQVAETTGGAAARAADTTAGRMKGLQIRFGELQEEIGTKLLPVAEKLVSFLTNVLDVMAANVGVVIFFGTAIGLVAAAVIAANIAIKLHVARLVLMKVAAAIATAVNFALATSITAVQVATGVGIAVVLAATAALATYVIAQKKLQAELQATADAAGNASTAIAGVTTSTFIFTQAQAKLTGANAAEGRARLAGAAAMDTYFESMNKTTTGTGAATKAVVEFGKQVKEGLLDALETAKTGLQTAQQVFNDFAGAVAAGVKVGLSFSAAYQLVQAAAENAGKASQQLTEAQTDLAKAITKGDVDEITKAQKALTEAQQADAAAAKENKETFLGRLAAQVQGVKDYADNLQILLARGLSQDALKHIIDAGGEAGAAIATQLVKGSTDLITGPQGVNELVASANAAADAVGINAATRFYQAGVDQATAIVDGIDAQLELLTPKLMRQMDKIAAGLARTVDVTVRIKEVVTRMLQDAVAPRATSPRADIIGPQAMSTSGFGGMSLGNRAQGVTVNVMGGLATSADIGQAVVNAIRAYNRQAGPANIQVA